MPKPTDNAPNTFWVYQDHRGVHNIVDSIEKVPPSLQAKASAVTVTSEEAEALRQAEPPTRQEQEYSAQVLDNGSEYADQLPPGINPDIMAAAGIFLLALVFLRKLAIHHGYKTFARITTIGIFTMTLGVIWTALGFVAKQNARNQEPTTQQEQIEEKVQERLGTHQELLRRIKTRD